MAPFDVLKQESQFMRNAAPQQFEKFRAAFQTYAAELVSNLLEANGDLECLQGRAQVAMKIMKMLEKIQ